LVTVLLHIAREWINGHARGFRWFSWLTGVPLLWLVYASGVGGYWLVWDQRAQFSLIATAEWLDWLPLFDETLARNFLGEVSISDRFFSLLIFLHIGIPLALLLGMWMHIQRLSRPRTNPPRVLALGTFAAFVALALVQPAASAASADLSRAPRSLDLDWLYLGWHALFYATSAPALWAFCATATLLLSLMPWLPRTARAPAARVDLANCNGCGRCFADCPYAAVTLVPRTDGKPMPLQARVEPDLCAACGICAGACPSSTPFRSRDDLASGIDMPQRPVRVLRRDLEQAIVTLRGNAKIVVFGCDCAADVSALVAPDTAVLPLLCTAMVPPSFVEYALRAGADGVLVTGCRQGDCQYRLGNRWTEERFEGGREPHLRARVPRQRIRVAWAGATDGRSLSAELEHFRQHLSSLPPQRGWRAPKRSEVVHG
jgi:coenzyme F420-reducing hydrogenase delta subunit/ferredoxin